MKKQLEDNTTSSKQWYYKQEDGRHQFIRGPFTRQEILEILEKGIINKNTLIRHSSGYWYPAFRYLSNSPIYQKIGESTVDDSNKKEETKQDNQAWQALKSKIQWDNLKTETKNTGFAVTKKEQKISSSTPPVEPIPSKGNEKLTNILVYNKVIQAIVVCILLLGILSLFTKKNDNIKSTNSSPNSIPIHSLTPAQPGESIPPIIPSTENQQNQNIRIVKKIVELHSTGNRTT